ncbi:MAG: hypothetical protein QM737_09690 [Ferruginibacter sp.]
MKSRAVKKIIIAFLLLLPVIAVAHYFVFPQETRCMLLPFSNFKSSGNLYYKKMDAEKMHQLQQLKHLAETKNSIFWKENIILDYKMIYCDDQQDFNKYASPYVPAATNMKMGAYIIIKDESIDENIIAHELSHTILYRNIGWYKRTFTIPAWFDEGLAMQVDDRNYYSIDSLLAKQNKGLQLPDVTKMNSLADFFAGDHETVMLHFSTAKYVVHEWLKTHSLKKFIEAINNGEDFEKAFSQK